MAHSHIAETIGHNLVGVFQYRRNHFQLVGVRCECGQESAGHVSAISALEAHRDHVKEATGIEE